ncbi:hypothetical protein GQ53DRAFT_672726 [Thozetella sp. PMI_491]|nr:hypothetical protein GQ53DRAFT_672726 [Thozetella sp. PMI_491]
MAQKARKDRAKSNATALTNLHVGSLAVNGLFLAFYAIFRSRSLLTWLLLSLPAFFCQFTLEKTGRPSFDTETKALKSAGEDLAAPGLTEYMWDVIWVTWGATVLVILVGNWGWLVWAVVPAYGAYKGYGLMGAARQMAGMNGMNGMDAGAPAPPANRKQRRAA